MAMSDPPLTPREMRLFITGRASFELNRRVLDDLNRDDSYAQLVLDGMELAAKQALNVDWRRLLASPGTGTESTTPEITDFEEREAAIRALIVEANQLSRVDRDDEARDLREQSCRLATQLWGREHRETATCLNGLAKWHHQMLDNNRARTLYEEALGIRLRVMGPTHSDTGITLSGLGRVFESQGDFRDAERCHRNALRISEVRLGRGPDTGVCLTDLGCTLLALGESRTALLHFQEALSISELIDGAGSRNAAIDRGNLANTFHALGELATAETFWGQSLKILEQSDDPSPLDVAWALNNLGSLRHSQGAEGAALECFDRARTLTGNAFQSPTLVYAVARNNLAVSKSAEDPRTSRDDWAIALDYANEAFGVQHPGSMVIAANLATSAPNAETVAREPSDAFEKLKQIYAAEFAKPRTMPFVVVNVPHQGQMFSIHLVVAA